MPDIQKILFEIELENGQFKVNAKETEAAIKGVGNSAKTSSSGFAGMANNVRTVTNLFKAFIGLQVVKQIFEIGKAWVTSGSKLQETQNKFDVVFKNSKNQAREFADTLVESYGLATEEAMGFLAGTGDILMGLEMQSDVALNLSNQVAQLGIDLASFSNIEGGAERAIAALTSSMTGEREALKAYGIVISEEMIQQELYAHGKDKLTGLALQQAKAEATIALAYKQSDNAIGDMARSFDSYANIQRRVDSRTTDLSAKLGSELIPSLSNLGLAFLSASKDGGILYDALQYIVKIAGKTINAIALITAKLNYQTAETKWGLASKEWYDASEAVEKYGAKLDASLDTNEKVRLAAAGGNKEAQKFLEALDWQERAYKKIEHLDDARNKAYQDGIELQKRLNNEEAISLGNKDAIAKREKERANENNKAGGNGKKTGKDTGPDATAEKKKQLEEEKKLIEEYGTLEVAAMYAKFDKFRDAYEKYSSFVVGLSGQLSELVSMAASNEIATIENNSKKRIEALNTEYEHQIALIDASSLSEEQKAAKKKALDEQLARDEKAINDKAAKDKRDAQIKAAKASKALQLFDTVVSTPAAAMQAFRSINMPLQPWTFPLAVGAAASTTALGMAKVKLIADQPLPSFAVGSLNVPRDMTANIHKGEMIIPKTFAESIRSGEGAIAGSSPAIIINVQGSVIDSQGLLAIVDSAQKEKASLLGATTYTYKSAYR